jgi:hypothetical protein
LEDFEGYHVWRGIEPDGSDLEIIGEISKEEAYWCIRNECYNRPQTHPSLLDAFYIFEFLPALRSPEHVYNSPFALSFFGFPCLGTTVRADVDSTEAIWYDCNAFNGFTYYYLVTSFDRGYSVLSGRQGLYKFDRCQPFGDPLSEECRSELVSMQIQVEPQSNLSEIYAVPNPFRTGGSRLTTSNYHNFPDDKIRFVNVPTQCKIKIFTVAGDLVWEYDHNDSGGNIEWDAKNRGNEDVASGVYVYRVEGPNGGQMYGRLIIIR